MFATELEADALRQAERALLHAGAASSDDGARWDAFARAMRAACDAPCDAGSDAHAILLAPQRAARRLIAWWRGGAAPGAALAVAADAAGLWPAIGAMVLAAAATEAQSDGNDGGVDRPDDMAELAIESEQVTAQSVNSATRADAPLLLLAAALDASTAVARARGRAATFLPNALRCWGAAALPASRAARAAMRGAARRAALVCPENAAETICEHLAACAYEAVVADGDPDEDAKAALARASAEPVAALGAALDGLEDAVPPATSLHRAAVALLEVWGCAPGGLPALAAVAVRLRALVACTEADGALAPPDEAAPRRPLSLSGGDERRPQHGQAQTCARVRDPRWVLEQLASRDGEISPEEGANALAASSAWLLEDEAGAALEEHVAPHATPQTMLALGASLSALAARHAMRERAAGRDARSAEEARVLRARVLTLRRLATDRVGGASVRSEWFVAANCAMNHEDFCALHAFAEADAELVANATGALVEWSNATGLAVPGEQAGEAARIPDDGKGKSEHEEAFPSSALRECPDAARLAALGAFAPSAALRVVLDRCCGGGSAAHAVRAAALLHAVRGLGRRRSTLPQHLVDAHAADGARAGLDTQPPPAPERSLWPELAHALRERLGSMGSEQAARLVGLLLNDGALALLTPDEVLAAIVMPCVRPATCDGADPEEMSAAAAFAVASVACDSLAEGVATGDGEGDDGDGCSDGRVSEGLRQVAADIARCAAASSCAPGGEVAERARACLPGLLAVALAPRAVRPALSETAASPHGRVGADLIDIVAGLPRQARLTAAMAAQDAWRGRKERALAPSAVLSASAIEHSAACADECACALLDLAAAGDAGAEIVNRALAGSGSSERLEAAHGSAEDGSTGLINLVDAAAVLVGAWHGHAQLGALSAGAVVPEVDGALALAAARVLPRCGVACGGIARAAQALEALAGDGGRAVEVLGTALELGRLDPEEVWGDEEAGMPAGSLALLAAALVEALRALGAALGRAGRDAAERALGDGFDVPALWVLASGRQPGR